MDGENDTKETLIKYMREMKQPTTLLKFGAMGKPKFRKFQISEDAKTLTWQSSKAADQTRILVSDMKELWFGQRTEKFKKGKRGDLAEHSFSVIFYKDSKNKSSGSDTLDLVCKDEGEFQTWTRGLQALITGKMDNLDGDDISNNKITTQNSIRGIGGSNSISSISNRSSTNSLGKLEKQGSGIFNKKNKNQHQFKDVFSEGNDIYAFGWSEWGQSGSDEVKEQFKEPHLLENLLGKGVVAISSGWSHTAVLLETRSVLLFGNRVGTGFDEDYYLPYPTEIPQQHSVVNLVCGRFHTVLLTDKGQVLSFGTNLNGQLGVGDKIDRKKPTLVSFDKKRIKAIDAGDKVTMALASNGQVYTWGSSLHGNLGINVEEDQTTPQLIKDLANTPVKMIACGGQHMIASTGKDVYSWGWNGSGQLGLGHNKDQSRPDVLEAFRSKDVVGIASGTAHAFAIIEEGKTNVVYAWGSNTGGQLGIGSKTSQNTPQVVTVHTDTSVKHVACGVSHSALLTDGGKLFTCGSNRLGQLGHGDNTSRTTFKLIDSLKERKSRDVDCGAWNTVVLTPRAFVKDDEVKECMICKTGFTLINRRHHCRNCGGIFCNPCSSKRIAILKYGFTTPVRVCLNCHDKLSDRRR